MAKTKVTTKNEPGKVITVEPRELRDLERMGLVDTYVSGPKAKKAETAEQDVDNGTDGGTTPAKGGK